MLEGLSMLCSIFLSPIDCHDIRDVYSSPFWRFDFDGIMLDSIRFNFIVQLVIVIAHEPEMYRQWLNNYGTVYT